MGVVPQSASVRPWRVRLPHDELVSAGPRSIRTPAPPRGSVDCPGVELTDAERRALAPYFTNVDARSSPCATCPRW